MLSVVKLGASIVCVVALMSVPTSRAAATEVAPYVVVLGIAQDGGVPQAGTRSQRGWDDAAQRRLVACLGLVDPTSGERWMFDATPDFKLQLHRLDGVAPVEGSPGLTGVFLTHAHMGHYTGLMFLGHESLGAREVKVHAMPRMAKFLGQNGPWDQLVRYRNIALSPLTANEPVRLNDRLSVTPILVPHRQEYSEVVGYRVTGPTRSLLFIPDIDSWDAWDEQGTRIEDEIAAVDFAYLDGTFFANGEIPGRDMSGFPHPFIRVSLERLGPLPASERAKVRFIHLNHTNPALREGEARREIERAGPRVADEMERVTL